nr:MAG TPA: hypothetical protein [Caudoviricetes sp.]
MGNLAEQMKTEAKAQRPSQWQTLYNTIYDSAPYQLQTFLPIPEYKKQMTINGSLFGRGFADVSAGSDLSLAANRSE